MMYTYSVGFTKPALKQTKKISFKVCIYSILRTKSDDYLDVYIENL